MDDDERTVVVLGGVIAFIVLACIVFLVAGAGLLWDRPASKYAEETRKQAYDTSRQFEQGTNRDIARYCEQMRGAAPQAGKAVAALIRSEASTYDGKLSDDNAACVAEAKEHI